MENVMKNYKLPRKTRKRYEKAGSCLKKKSQNNRKSREMVLKNQKMLRKNRNCYEITEESKIIKR